MSLADAVAAAMAATASKLPSPLQLVPAKPVSITLVLALFTLALLDAVKADEDLSTTWETPPVLETFSSYEDMQRYFDHRNQRRLRHIENPSHDSYIEAYNQHNEEEEQRVKRAAPEHPELKIQPALIKFEMTDAVEPSDEVKQLIRQYKSRELQQNEKYMETVPPSNSNNAEALTNPIVKRNPVNDFGKQKVFGKRLNRPKRSTPHQQPANFRVKYIPFEVTDAREPDTHTKNLIKRMRALDIERLTKQLPRQETSNSSVAKTEHLDNQSTTTKKPLTKRSKHHKQWKPKRTKREAAAPEMIKFEIADAKDPDPSLKTFMNTKKSRETKDLKLESTPAAKPIVAADTANSDQNSQDTKKYFVYKEAPTKVKKSIEDIPHDVQNIISHLIKGGEGGGGGGGGGGGKAYLKYIPAQQMDYNNLKAAYPIANGAGAFYGHGGGGAEYGNYANAVPVKFVYQPLVMGAGHGGGYMGGGGGGGAVAVPVKYVALGGGEAGYGGGEGGHGGGYAAAGGGHGGGYAAVAGGGHAGGYAVGGGGHAVEYAAVPGGHGGGYAAGGGGHGGGYVAAGGGHGGGYAAAGGGHGGGYVPAEGGHAASYAAAGGGGHAAGYAAGGGGHAVEYAAVAGGHGGGYASAGGGHGGGYVPAEGGHGGGYAAAGGGGHAAGYAAGGGGHAAGYAAAGSGGHAVEYAAVAGGHGGGYAAGGGGHGVVHAAGAGGQGGGHAAGGGGGYEAGGAVKYVAAVAPKAAGYGGEGGYEAGRGGGYNGGHVAGYNGGEGAGYGAGKGGGAAEEVYAAGGEGAGHGGGYAGGGGHGGGYGLVHGAGLGAHGNYAGYGGESSGGGGEGQKSEGGGGSGGGAYVAAHAPAAIVHPMVVAEGGGGGGQQKAAYAAGFAEAAAAKNAGNEAIKAIPAPQFKGETKYSVVPTVEQYAKSATQDFHLKLYSPESLIAKAQLIAKDQAKAIAEEGQKAVAAAYSLAGAKAGAAQGRGKGGYAGAAGKDGGGYGGAEGGFGNKLGGGGGGGGKGGGGGGVGKGDGGGGGYEEGLNGYGGGKGEAGGYGGGGGAGGAGPVIKIEYHAPAESFKGNYKEAPEFQQLSALVGKSPEDQIHGLTYLLAKEMQNRLQLQRQHNYGGGSAVGKAAGGFDAGKGGVGGAYGGDAEAVDARPQDNKAPVLFLPQDAEGAGAVDGGGKGDGVGGGGGGAGGFYQPIVGKYIGMAKSKQYIPVIEQAAGEELKGAGSALAGKGGAGDGGGLAGKFDGNVYGLSGNYKGLGGLKGFAGGLVGKSAGAGGGDKVFNAKTYEEAAAKLQSYASKYAFGYRIRDFNTGNDFGHKQNRDLHGVTRGQYHILLPDGRIQNVIYHADDTGFHADVSFESGR